MTAVLSVVFAAHDEPNKNIDNVLAHRNDDGVTSNVEHWAPPSGVGSGAAHTRKTRDRFAHTFDNRCRLIISVSNVTFRDNRASNKHK